VLQANLGELRMALESFAKAKSNGADTSGSEQDLVEWQRLVQEQGQCGQASRVKVVGNKD
jgi:hypothetical protein